MGEAGRLIPVSTEGVRRRSRGGVLLAAAVLSFVLAASAMAAIGGLTQKPGTAGCISDDGTGGACVDGTALVGAVSVAVSPDGTSAYVASETSDSVTIFDRDPTTGALTQKPGTAGCISDTGTGGACVRTAQALDGARFGDGLLPTARSAYVAAPRQRRGRVFDREPRRVP